MSNAPTLCTPTLRARRRVYAEVAAPRCADTDNQPCCAGYHRHAAAETAPARCRAPGLCSAHMCAELYLNRRRNLCI